MLKIQQEANLTSRSSDIKFIYNKYSGMLLGYITEIVKDHKQAEEYLIKVFLEVAKAQYNGDLQGFTSWNQLRRFALNILPVSKSLANDEQTAGLTLLNKLSDSQQQIFQAVYYQGISTAAIAAHLNQPEDFIRKTLKEAFNIMRANREN